MQFKCQKCAKIFPDETTTKSHNELEPECVSDTTKSSLTQRYKQNKDEKGDFERKREKGSANTKWNCKFCEKEFKLKKKLKVHIKSKHFILKCKECNTEFKDKHEYTEHVKQHDLFCMYCNEELKTTSKISHFFSKHNICPCGEKFENKNELELHLDKSHNKFQVYKPKPRKENTEKLSLNPDYI